MNHPPGPSPGALGWRAAVLLSLIVQAVVLYARIWLGRRGIFALSEEQLTRRAKHFARRFVAAAMRFRGGLIKLGQVASLRVDVMPPEVTDELARLQDRVEPHAFSEIVARVERELGASIGERFAAFDPEPLAAASLGQVHRARHEDGRELAVKVLYPGIERSVAVDLAMTKLALWLFDFISVADLTQVYRELRDTLRGEMDYLQEGRAAEEVAHNLGRDPELAARIRVPKIAWELTTRCVLSMEFLEGVKINDTAALEAQETPVTDRVLWVSRAFLHMMFRDGFFHCDPHPGNLLVGPDGRIGIVDFGMHRRLEPRILAAFRKNVMASLLRNADLYAESLLDADIVDRADVPAVKALAEMSFDPAYYNLTPQEMANLDFGEYFRRMRREMKRIRSFRLPDGLVMWSRALSLLYALVVELAPGMRPLDVLGPYAAEFLQPGVQPAPVNPDVSHPSKTV